MRTALVIGLLVARLAVTFAHADPPRPQDPRLTLELVAAAPEIVTPTGLAVDARGRVFVVESHTHFRPKDYDGPPADRIRVLEDTDHDGRADRVSTFFEGTTYTMALAFESDGSLVVATRSEIFRLRDADGDGRADEPRQTLAKLITRGDYPHNGLAGVTLDFAGTLRFGLGENLGEPYQLVATDGTTLKGGGEGGNIYRMNADGSKLERIATGFWNPFGMAFDTFGRLFAVDNDPDARPPCRLLHIVEGGDYGYRFRNGRRGIHPFTSWNGELPGTLPMVAGTGEAPSGLIVYESDNLPEEYRGALLATSWGDHRIERYRLRSRGASFISTMEPVVTGGEDFRPVAIAVAPDGSLYFSDWVDKSYSLHGQGRVWRLRATRAGRPDRDHGLLSIDRRLREFGARVMAERPARHAELVEFARASPDPHTRAVALEALASAGATTPEIAAAAALDESADVRGLAVRRLRPDQIDLAALAARDASPEVRAEALRRLADPAARDTLLAALDAEDPFLRQAARAGLGRSLPIAELGKLADDADARRRLGILLTLRATNQAEAHAVLAKALDDPDPDVRFVAVEWVGEERLGEFKDALRRGLADRSLTRTLFEATLAALERVDGRRHPRGEEVGGQDYIAALVVDPDTPPVVLRRALRSLRADHPALTIDRLRRYLESSDTELRREAVRTLRDAPHAEKSDRLAALAADRSQPADLRAEALAGLRPESAGATERLVGLAADESQPPAVRAAATRSLRGAELTPEQRRPIAANEPLGRILDPRPAAPPAGDLDAWLARIDASGIGDPAEGERIFFHPDGPGCYRCHRVEGRGGRAGPELTLAAPGLTRRRLVESIVRPSQEIAPQFVPWVIARNDGTVATGLLVEEAVNGEQTYVDSAGRPFTVRPDEIAERRPASASLMPEDLPAAMTVEEFRDLLAFLQGSRRP